MAKQLNVNLAFSADTTQAQAAIRNLVTQLQAVTHPSATANLPITKEILEAQVAAKRLGETLQASFNKSTGSLDLTKLTQELNKSGMSLTQYGQKLSALGPTGDKAFLQVAQAIAQTQAPLRRTNGMLAEFATTLKNTARWQISSSLLHGFMGAVQSAYGYAQDLDESLNNIRIVTGQSSEQMAEFAANANKAAKALNTTTTAYTNAALIYYQQGDSDSTVLEKTDVTTKMANVTGQSAEVVSDQLTAIWNNFNKAGEESYERFADVLTALGAATASSTDEIAGGLEKFASIADMIGLSYDYAATALATITATTRQSEEVVGTALKTIFARIQGLSLGETLDDGTNLNKYSKALEKVGISIYEQNGELKDMDNILNEMGAKWETLSKDQQVALAQTVAGVRQYNQLVSLMDNWDYFGENLEVAQNATGELDRQADIYAESWEASKNRVKASAQEIYASLIDEDFFIGVNDVMSEMLGGISSFIDALGGVKGVLSVVGLLVTSIFKESMANGINNALYNLRVFSGMAQSEFEKVKSEAYDAAMALTEGFSDLQGVQALRQSLQTTYELQKQLSDEVRKMSPEQRAAAESALQLAQEYNEAAIAAGKAADEAAEMKASLLASSHQARVDNLGRAQAFSDNAMEQSGDTLIASAQNLRSFGKSAFGIDQAEVEGLTSAIREYSNLLHTANVDQDTLSQSGTNLVNVMQGFVAALGASGASQKAYEAALQSNAEAAGNAKVSFDALQKELSEGEGSSAEYVAKIRELVKTLKAAGFDVSELEKKLKSLSGTQGKYGKDADQTRQKQQEVVDAFKRTTITTKELTAATAKKSNQDVYGKKTTHEVTDEMMKQAGAAVQVDQTSRKAGSAMEVAGNQAQEAARKIKEKTLAYQSFGSAITGTLQGISSFGMALNSLKSLKDTISNDDLSTFEKTTQIMMSLGMTIPMLTTGIKSLGNAWAWLTATEEKGFAVQVAQKVLNREDLTITSFVVKAKTGEVIARRETAEAAAAEAAGVAGATVVEEIHAKSVWETVAALLAKMAAMLPYVAIAAAVGVAIYAIVKAYNAEAEALETANKALEESTNAYNNATNAANKFKDAVKDYQDGIKSLEDFTGTQTEFNQALEESNKKARELIETYGLFDKYNVVNGAIVIDEDALKEIENKQNDIVRKAKIGQMSAEIHQNNAQLANDATQLARNTVGSIYDPMASESGIRQATGAEVKALAEVIDKVSVITDEHGNVISETTLSADKLKEKIRENAGEFGLSTTIMQNLDTFINDNTINSLYNYTESMDEATAANKYYAEQILGIATSAVNDEKLREMARGEDGEVDEALYSGLTAAQNKLVSDAQNTADQTIGELSEQYQNKISNVKANVSTYDAANTTEGNVQNLLQEILGDSYSDDWISKNYGSIFTGTSLGYDGDINSQEMGKAYLESQGYTVTSVKDKSGRTVYSGTDADGKTFEQTIDNEIAQQQWADAILQYAAQQALTAKSEDIINQQGIEDTLQKIVDGGQAFGADFSNSVLSAISNDGKFNFESLFGEFTQSEVDAMMNMSEEEIAQLLGISVEDISALGLDSGKGFVENFKAGFEGFDYEEAMQNIDNKGTQEATSFGIDKDEFEAYRDLLAKELPEAYKENRKGLNEVAIANKRLEKGVKTLGGDWEDLNEIMTDETSTIEDISSILPTVNEGLQDILNLDSEQFELLPPDFAQKNWSLIQDVMNGVEGSVDVLRNKAGEEILLNVGAKVDADGDGSIDAVFAELHSLIAEYDGVEDFEVGVAIDPAKHAKFLETCNSIINAAGMTAEQAQAYFASMGYDAVVEEQPVKANTTATYSYYKLDEAATEAAGGVPQFESTATPIEVTRQENATALAVKTITPNGSYGGGVGVNTKPPKTSTSTKDSSGGDKKPAKKVDSTKKSDVVDRYKEVTDSLDDVRDATDKAAKSADRLWGKSRINALKQQNGLIQQEIGLLKQQRAEAEKNIIDDKQALKDAAAEAGVNFNIDPATGNILNYTSEMNKLYGQLKTAEDNWNSSYAGKTSEDESKYKEEVIQPLQDKINALKEAISAYEETRELIEDLDTQIDDKFYEWQDNNYEILHHTLEVAIQVNDQDMKILEYFMEKVEEDVYSIAEGFHLWNSELGPAYNILKSNLSAQSDFYDEITAAYNAGNISQDAFIDGLFESEDAILENLEALKDLDDQMMEWYSNTLSLVSEELDYWGSQLEHQSELLDHYKDIVTLVNGENDYDSIGTILEGTAKAKKDQMEVAEATYNMWAAEEAAIRAQMEGWDKDSEEYKKLESDLREVQEKVNEAEIEMLESTQEWAQAMQDVMVNTFDKAAMDLEMAFTNGMGFDSLMSSLDRLSTYQDTFLTKTNQLYETEKLMRTAQQAADKTTNEAAKAKLKNYIEETEALKNKNQLSNVELEIQQAKYDVLLAEIALEEAKNAKSTVRLQRDNEGNFGYVYTADQDKISQAEQDLADAENELYNIRLDAANDNAQKIIELNQQMYDDITALNQAFHVDQTISEEQYNAEMARLREEYGKLYTAYSNDYTAATTEDSRIQDEAWTTAYQSMVEEADDWQEKIGDYTDTCETAYADYRKKIETESPTIKKLLDGPDGVSDAVKSVTDESEALRKKMVEQVVPQMSSALSNVRDKTATYMSQVRQQVQETINKYEALLLAMQKVGQEEAKAENTQTTQNVPETPKTETPETPKAETPVLAKGASVTVKTTATNFTRDAGRGTHMQSWVPGSTFTVMGISGNEVLIGRNGGYTGWVNKSDLEGFRTGGYTGEWGPDGKLALLHEKELILNQEDTKNMFGIVSLVHDIISQIDLRANNQSSFGSFMSSPSYNGGNSILEQDVHIEAHFPNATNHSEIEEAFGNLINLASQYANRK